MLAAYTFQMCVIRPCVHAEVRSPHSRQVSFYMLILDSLHVYTDPPTVPPILTTAIAN